VSEGGRREGRGMGARKGEGRGEKEREPCVCLPALHPSLLLSSFPHWVILPLPPLQSCHCFPSNLAIAS